MIAVFVAMGVATVGAGAAFFFLAVRAPTVPDQPPPPVTLVAPQIAETTPVEGLPEAPTRPSKTTAPAPQRPTPAPQKSAKTGICAQAAAACAEDPRGTRCSTLQAKCTP
jgi:type IV secretory pathway VirB10-like protein